MRAATALLLGGLTLLLLTRPALADDAMTPSGTIDLTTESVGVVIGYRWGSGVLTYQGKTYPFAVDGLSIGDLGGDKAQASGDVFKLTKLEDFNGTYKGAAANLTIVGGGGGNELTNEHGVILRLSRTTVGLKLKVGVDGVRLKLKDKP